MLGSVQLGISDGDILPQDKEMKELGLLLDSISDSCVRRHEVVATATNIPAALWATRRDAKAWNKVRLEMKPVEFYIAANP